MTTAERSPTPKLHAVLLRALLWLGLSGSAALGLLRTMEALAPAGQWDFESYYYAARVHAAGGDAYDEAALKDEAGHRIFPFVYPHHTLLLFQPLARLDVATAKLVYFIAKLICAAALVGLWLVLFVRGKTRLWFVVFVMLGYNAALWRDVVTGNVVTFEQVFLWLGIAALVCGRPFLFSGALVASAQFKLMGAPLLLLGFARGRRCGMRALVLGGVGLVAVGAAVYLSNPEMSKRFSDTSRRLWQSERGDEKNPSTRVLIWDVVGSVARQADWLDNVDRRAISLPIYVAHCIAVVWLTWRALTRLTDVRVRIYLMILAYAIIMPRLRDYSYILLFVPTFELLRLNLARWRSVPLGLALLPLLLTLPGSDIVWPYRNLVLAWITWALSLSLTDAPPEPRLSRRECG